MRSDQSPKPNDLAAIFPMPLATIEVSTQALGEILSALQEASCYLTMLLQRKLETLGVDDFDEAAELSNEFCDLAYLEDLVERAEAAVELQAEKVLFKS